MTVFIALLRAVNVGGHGKIAMADLRTIFVDAGFGDARTLLQTGNVVFSSDKRGGGALEAALEKISAAAGLSTDFFVRDAAQWAKIIKVNPFPDEAKSRPGQLVVMVLKKAPPASAVEALRAAIKGREAIAAEGPQIYIHYPDGIGRSKLTSGLIERKLGTRGTGRNWNTVTKLADLAAKTAD